MRELGKDEFFLNSFFFNTNLIALSEIYLFSMKKIWDSICYFIIFFLLFSFIVVYLMRKTIRRLVVIIEGRVFLQNQHLEVRWIMRKKVGRKFCYALQM